MKRNIIDKRALISNVLQILLFVSSLISYAEAGETAGSYSLFTFKGEQPIKNQTFRMQVVKDPGSASNVFWANNFLLGNGVDGGYVGYQSNGTNQLRTFIFSVWNVKEYRTGSPSSYCLNFDGEGEGISCRMQHAVEEGHIYRQTLSMGEDNWTTATVVDETTGEEFTLGAIKLNYDHLSREISKWVEYFEWSDPNSNCFDQPYSKVNQFTPTANDGSLVGTLDSSSPSNNECKDMVDISVTSYGTVQTLNIGNSIKGPIKGLDNKIMTAEYDLVEGSPITLRSDTHSIANIAAPWIACLDVKDANSSAGAITQLTTCSGHRAQKWIQEGQQLKSYLSGLCLTQSNQDVLSEECSKSALQKWKMSGTALKNIGSGQCLSLKDQNLNRYTVAQMANCNDNIAQQWVMLNGSSSNRWVIGANQTIRASYGFCISPDMSATPSENGDIPVILSFCSGEAEQQWEIVNGIIKNTVTGKCIDDPNFITDEGTALVLHDCNGSAAQHWETPEIP